MLPESYKKQSQRCNTPSVKNQNGMGHKHWKVENSGIMTSKCEQELFLTSECNVLTQFNHKWIKIKYFKHAKVYFSKPDFQEVKEEWPRIKHGIKTGEKKHGVQKKKRSNSTQEKYQGEY